MGNDIEEGIFDTAKEKVARWIDKSIKYINSNWDTIKVVTNREKRETIIAIGILKDIIVGREVTDNERKFLKSQLKDIIKILFLISIKFIPAPIPFTPIAIFLGKKLGISILPTSQPQLPYRN
jgi:hypothetical protein